MTAPLARLDQYQRSHRWLGFPVAVAKKFGQDQAGNLAALISYYAFFSFFPLLLAFVTVLGFVLAGDPAMERRVMGTVSEQFPGLGQAIMPAGRPLTGSGFGLAIGLLLAVWAGLAVANAAQNGFNTVWQVPLVDRPNLLHRTVRSVALVAVLGVNIVVTTAISTLSSGATSLHVGLDIGARTLLLGASLVVNVALFSLAFRLLTVREVRFRTVLPGAVLAAVGWQILQWFGGYIITRRLSSSATTYGTFAVVIGLLTWFFVLGQLVLLATELNVVTARRLWPRSLTGPPTTDADRRVYQGYASMQRLAPGVRVVVHFDAPTDTG
ncbi:YihY/virulence factor BrkB family protein [Actinocatenispora rupis]|uniref:Inner membrane protein YhjD n=1 Tax=Actinocatenispora rupis TaxID=519421 RepID=A0A8J3J2H9_9ACTN|nr:YihY/virulence factor BrkB family protein [Actinocatenispora rupis]GID10366.1 inner membrane protein YhjD [Actinocatenispora rupis]